MLSSFLVFVYLFVSSDYFLQLFVITCVFFMSYTSARMQRPYPDRRTALLKSAYLVYVINLSFTFSLPVCSKTKQEYRIN